MALAKLTASGAVQVSRPWARPQIYVTWLSLLADGDGEAIRRAMNAAIDNRDVVRAQYIVCRPGQGDDWFDVYEPAYESMNRDYTMAAKFIGLILWEVMQARQEQWYFHKIDKTFVDEHNLMEDIHVVEYFRAATLPAALKRREALS
jgi:hypothetical protein